MATCVTTRANEVRQPRGGYVPIKLFEARTYDDGIVLSKNENLHPSVIGTVIDNLTRMQVRLLYWTDGSPRPKASAIDAFDIALQGAEGLSSSDLHCAQGLVAEVHGLDDNSIVHACMLSTYDACRRAGRSAYVAPESLIPNSATIENIRTMVNRCVQFFEKKGPVTCVGPTFTGGYTRTVLAGDGDLLTNDAIWDIKVLRKKPDSKKTLQLYMYYLMGKRSQDIEFLSIKSMGIFNPRLHMAWELSADKIDDDVKNAVEYKVIGYETPDPYAVFHTEEFQNRLLKGILSI